MLRGKEEEHIDQLIMFPPEFHLHSSSLKPKFHQKVRKGLIKVKYDNVEKMRHQYRSESEKLFTLESTMPKRLSRAQAANERLIIFWFFTSQLPSASENVKQLTNLKVNEKSSRVNEGSAQLVERLQCHRIELWRDCDETKEAKVFKVAGLKFDQIFHPFIADVARIMCTHNSEIPIASVVAQHQILHMNEKDKHKSAQSVFGESNFITTDGRLCNKFGTIRGCASAEIAWFDFRSEVYVELFVTEAGLVSIKNLSVPCRAKGGFNDSANDRNYHQTERKELLAE